MKNSSALGSWIRRFLLEYLVGERNLAHNTQQSYRDAVRLLVVFVAAKSHKKVDELLIPDIDAGLLRAFLRHIEEKRKCSIASRNQRLAAIHALAGFIAERCPEYLDWCAQLRAVKSKRSAPMPVCYLEKPEIDALLDAPNPATTLGHRDRALLLFMYNSGARADEAAKLCIDDLSLHSGTDCALSSVCLHGKECHSYCIFLRPRHETTGTHACRQAYDLAFSWADILPVVRTGIGLGPYTDAHGASRVEPMSEPYPA
jgi:integrase/recombinase XerD